MRKERTKALGPSVPCRRSADVQEKAESAATDLYKIHGVLGSYFSALAALAADDLPKVDKQADSLSDAITMLDPNFGEDKRTAFSAVVKLLSLPLDAYRQREIRKLMNSQHDNIDKLLSVLEQASEVIASDLKAEEQSIADPFSSLLGDIRDPGMKFLITDRMLMTQHANADALSAIADYRMAIANVRANHKNIRDALDAGARGLLKPSQVSLTRGIRLSRREVRYERRSDKVKEITIW